MLERLLTSTTRVKLLGLMLFNQHEKYHLRGISKLIRVSPIYVSRELTNLEKIGLVKSYRQANLKMFILNKDCPIAKELKEIFLKTDFIGDLLRKSIGFGVKYCFIYGSFARGDESITSDIDLFVIGSLKEDKLIEAIQKAEERTGREINFVLWDEKTFNERMHNHHLLKSIKQSPLVMIIGDEDEFRRLL